MYLPDQDAYIILGRTIVRKWGYTCSKGYTIVNLNKARTKKIITTSCLICITLSH